eukprot:1147385-Pelagomonas_calceolata.AAC.5
MVCKWSSIESQILVKGVGEGGPGGSLDLLSRCQTAGALLVPTHTPPTHAHAWAHACMSSPIIRVACNTSLSPRLSRTNC